jgi:serine/threonine-protein kinase ATR
MEEFHKSCLQIAKVCRISQQLQIAKNAILQARISNAQNYYIENAKLLWKQGNTHQAILELKNSTQKDEVLKSKTILLIGRWLQSTTQVQSNEIITYFNDSIKLQPKWEKGYFYLGRYYDYLLVQYKEQLKVNQVNTQLIELLHNVVKNYSKSLLFGHKFIFISLPRLLTLWFDCGAITSSFKSDVWQNTYDLMEKWIAEISSYKLYTCYPQVVSRICHSNDAIHKHIFKILVKVLKDYPHQASWHITAINISLNTTRQEKAKNVFKSATKESTSNLLEQAKQINFYLLELANYSISKDTIKLSIPKNFSKLSKFLQTPKEVIIPLQTSLAATLPNADKLDKSFNVFPSNLATIFGIKDDVEVMPSLQRPRKITFKGSDGREYLFLVKPKDDLRKDCRMMEFNTMINKLLKKDSNCRRRNLCILLTLSFNIILNS